MTIIIECIWAADGWSNCFYRGFIVNITKSQLAHCGLYFYSLNEKRLYLCKAQRKNPQRIRDSEKKRQTLSQHPTRKRSKELKIKIWIHRHSFVIATLRFVQSFSHFFRFVRYIMSMYCITGVHMFFFKLLVVVTISSTFTMLWEPFA